MRLYGIYLNGRLETMLDDDTTSSFLLYSDKTIAERIALRLKTYKNAPYEVREVFIRGVVGA